MPSHIERHVSVACPYADAALRLHRFFQSTGNRAGDSALLPLRFEVPVPGLADGISVGRTVLATMQAMPKREKVDVRYRIQWAPEHPGPFPLFAGELSADSENAVDRFVLRLTGTYQPPLGAAGVAFDGIVGNRIAQRTASRLLGQIRDSIEVDFHDAASAPVQTPHPIVSRTPSVRDEHAS